MNKNKYLPSLDWRRRSMVSAAAAWSILACSGSVRAQGQPPVLIGWLNNGPRVNNGHYLRAFKEGMAALGWKENANYVLEERWAESVAERLPQLAQEVAARKPAVIVAATLVSVCSMSKAAPAIPLVQADGGSLVAAGLATSLARPGGMVTGVTNIAIDFAVKFLEYLLETVPTAKRIGFLVDGSGNTTMEPLAKAYQELLLKRQVQGYFARVANPDAIDKGMRELAQQGVQGLVLFPATFFVAERERIMKIALANRWPISCGPHEFAEAGALMCYGPDRTALYRRSAYYVDRILKGTKPADLPIEQPTKFELIVNLKTARTLGLKLPQTILVRADRVIE